MKLKEQENDAYKLLKGDDSQKDYQVKRVLEHEIREHLQSINGGLLPIGIAYKAPRAYTDKVLKDAKARKSDDVAPEDSLKVFLEDCQSQGMQYSLLLTMDDNGVETVSAVVYHDPSRCDVKNYNFGLVQSDVTFGLLTPGAGFDKTSFTHGVTLSTFTS